MCSICDIYLHSAIVMCKSVLTDLHCRRAPSTEQIGSLPNQQSTIVLKHSFSKESWKTTAGGNGLFRHTNMGFLCSPEEQGYFRFSLPSQVFTPVPPLCPSLFKPNHSLQQKECKLLPFSSRTCNHESLPCLMASGDNVQTVQLASRSFGGLQCA